MERIAASADSISLGDITDNIIRSENCWSLLPLEAVYASVIPGHEMSGKVPLSIKFPNWFQQNTNQKNYSKTIMEITHKTSIQTRTTKKDFVFDYLQPMKSIVINHLLAKNNNGALKILQHYNLVR